MVTFSSTLVRPLPLFADCTDAAFSFDIRAIGGFRWSPEPASTLALFGGAFAVDDACFTTTILVLLGETETYCSRRAFRPRSLMEGGGLLISSRFGFLNATRLDFIFFLEFNQLQSTFAGFLAKC